MIAKELLGLSVKKKKYIGGSDLSGPWRIPVSSKELGVSESMRANKYLKRQNDRFLQHLVSGNMYTAWMVYKWLVMRSWSFRIYYFNKMIKGWYYNFNKQSIHSQFIKMTKIMENSDGNLKSRRVYIQKDSGKWRPVGVPNSTYRVFIGM